MSRYQHELDASGRCSVEGYNAEQEFRKLLNERAAQAEESTLQEQFDGIDVKSASIGTFDVKAMKRKSRAEIEANDRFIWVEFKNVAGYKGWLYSRADYIAFERQKDFVIVKRKELVNLCETLCDFDSTVWRASRALYKGYQRKDRNDLVSMIKMSDIFEYINYYLLPKHEEG